jgi:hypothetical protein
MTINTDISNPNLTKFAKYMFYIEQGMYFPLALQEAFQKLEPTLSETFDSINVYVDDENSKDYSIKEELESDNPFYLYFIYCDTRNPRFKTQLNAIKKYDGFIDCYQYENKKSNKAIIRYKVFIKNRMHKMIDSKYSEMYQEQEYTSISNNKTIQSIYSHYSYVNSTTIFDKSFHVLLRSDEYLEQLIDELKLTDTKTIEILSESEFDSKYSIDNETIKFKNKN